MARYRQTPKCIFCGEPTARPIHTKRVAGFIGDTFLRWEKIEHTCAGTIAHDKKIKEWQEENKDVFKTINDQIEAKKKS